MADYRIEIGAELRTKDIDTTIKNYKGDVKVGADANHLKDSIDAALTGYTYSKEITVKSDLDLDGINKKIEGYSSKQNRKKIKVALDHDHLFDGLETTIGNKTFKTPLKVNVDLNWAGVASKIANPDFGAAGKPTFHVDVDFDDQLIETKWNTFAQSESKKRKLTIPIKPTLTGADAAEVFGDVEATLRSYTAKNKLKVSCKLDKTQINKDIAEYNQKLAQNSGKKIIFNAKLRANAIDDAIKDYKAKYSDRLQIPIDFKVNSTLDGNSEFETERKRIIQQYESNPVQLPVVLTPASKGFKDQISKIKIPVTAELTNAEVITNAIEGYQNKPLTVKAKLIPAQGFTSELTKTPIPINAKLSEGAIAELNTAITNPSKSLAKLPLGVTLKRDAKELNPEVTALSGLVTEKLNVGVNLDKDNINADIALFQPTATLGIKPDLIIENVDDQIRTYVPKEKIKVHLDLIDNNINTEAGKQKSQTPITINVELDRDNLNEQIRTFTPKDKIPVGVELNRSDIETEIQNIQTNTPIKLGVELDPNGVKNVQNQVDNLRQQLEDLGDIAINIGSNGIGAGNGSGAGGNGNVNRSNSQQTGKIISDAAERSIKKISSKEIGELFKVNKIDSDSFENEMNNLVKKWTDGKGNVVDIQIETRTHYDKKAKQNIEELSKAHVTYKNAANESIKKTLEWRQIGAEKGKKGKEAPVMGWVESHAKYQKSLEKTKSQTDIFIKQQKKATSDLTNTINQLNSAATDQAAPRPIKEQSHLKSLGEKYNEITDAITRMRNASRDTFDDERNTVNRLISEYKILTKQYKNAENVANKMSGTDYESGRKIAEQNLAEFKTKAKDYAQMSKTIGDLDKTFNKVGDASSLKEFTNQLRVAKAELAKVKVEANSANLGKNLRMDVSSLKDGILSFQNANPKIAEFKTKIDGAEVSVESLLNDLSEVKTKGDLSVVNHKFGEFAKAAKNAGVALNDTVVKVKTIKDIKNKLKDLGFEGFAQEVSRAHADVEKLETSTDKLQDALTRVDNAFDSIQTADEADDMKALTAANEEYEESLRRLYSLITLQENVQKAEFDADILSLDKANALLKLEGLFEQGSQAARKYGTEVQRLRDEINNCADSDDMQKINKQISILEKQVKSSNLQTKTLGTRFKEQFSRYTNYISIASIFMYATQAARNMFEQVKLIDSAMTELKKVTNETDASYNQFLSNAASRAKELGTTIDGLVASTADFARLGYGFEDSQKLAEVANIYAVVGDEIEGVEDATQSLVSTLAAFRDQMNGVSDSDFAMSIVDKMNEVSNNFAISSGGIGEALQRSASSMAAANNSLDETIAMITAANEVAQNPEKVGNAMKTKFLYNCLNVQKCA